MRREHVKLREPTRWHSSTTNTIHCTVSPLYKDSICHERPVASLTLQGCWAL